MSLSSEPVKRLTAEARYCMLVAAFLGWMCAGVQMSITSLAMRSAALGLLGDTGVLDVAQFNALSAQEGRDPKSLSAELAAVLDHGKALVARWFAWYQCAFLFGAALGGLLFGRWGDRLGRANGMAASILCYSLFSGAAYFAAGPAQLLLLRFLACLGVGGMWPNGVALVSEAWSDLSRPMVAGIIGTSANVGIFLMAWLAGQKEITADSWRWVMLAGAAPVVLGLFALLAVPESPRWLAGRAANEQHPDVPAAAPTAQVFRAPFLKSTLIGIALATVPLIGGWGSANWMMPWADEAGQAASPPNPMIKAEVGKARAITGIVGSLLGGWVASLFGRRRGYFLTALGALVAAQYAFWFTTPTDALFLFWVSALGFFSGIFFGWLPLFLPELFPTRVRSTGAGVSFNFGRILTAVTVFATGMLIDWFGGDYAKIGRVTSLIYAVGMLVIPFAPDTADKELED